MAQHTGNSHRLYDQRRHRADRDSVAVTRRLSIMAGIQKEIADGAH